MSGASDLLLVEDDEALAAVLSRRLAEHGFRVAWVADPESALARAAQVTPSHALLDLRLGERNGIELIPRLLERCPELVIVVLTGYASIATAVEAMRLGARNYLAKPAGTAEIVAALRGEQPLANGCLPATPMSLRRLEWEHLQRVLRDHGGNVSAAARALRIDRRTLQRKLAKRPLRH